MAEPTIVLFGTLEHPTLSILYHYLLERGRRRVVYLANEAFPRQPGFDYELSDEFEGGRFVLADQPVVEFEDIVSVGLDGYYVQPDGLEGFNERDREYLQTESWAALIGIFAGLSRRCRVANHILRRDDLTSRLAMLAYLQSHGVSVPNVCVTSDPDAAKSFIDEHGGHILHRPVAVRELPMRLWTEDDEPRLELLPLCPVHFEEHLESPLFSVTRIGDLFLPEPSDLVLPPAFLQSLQLASQGLDLRLCEFGVRESSAGWVCTSLYPFLRPRALADPETAELVAEYFEA